MEFWKAIFGLLRRILIGPPLVLLAVAVGVGAFFVVQPKYTADVSIVLATPVNGGTVNTDKTKQGLTNPFLSFNDALKIGASIVILSMNTQDVWTQLGAPKDGPTEITINDGRTNPNVLDISGPYIYIQVASDSPEKASQVLMTARKRVASELYKWQKALGAPANTFITSTDIVPPSRPEVDHSSRVEAAIGGGVVALLLGLAIAYGVTRRQASRLVKAPAGAPSATEAAPVVEAAPLAEAATVPETAHANGTANGTAAVKAPQPTPPPVPAQPPAPEPAIPAAISEPFTKKPPLPADDDSSSTMEFPAYRVEDLSTVPGKARQDDGGE